jgi:hypothetical protein
MNNNPKSKNFRILKILTKNTIELNTTDPLNRYLTIQIRLKELAELKLGDTVQRYKSRFKNDSNDT